MTATAPNPLAMLLAWTVRGYQRLISRYTPSVCRFEPTCSHYAVTAFRRHGPLRGLALAAWRVARCNPFNPGGYDPVPPRRGAVPGAGDGAGEARAAETGRGGPDGQ